MSMGSRAIVRYGVTAGFLDLYFQYFFLLRIGFKDSTQAYQLSEWKFCGVGAFQCYDANALNNLAAAAKSAGAREVQTHRVAEKWGTHCILKRGGPGNMGDLCVCTIAATSKQVAKWATAIQTHRKEP